MCWRKISKNRLTGLMCVNMTGTDNNDSLLLENHKHHLVSKNVKKRPVEYVANKKACMSSDIFQQYVSGTTK
jgi:hypothetical protein